MTRVTMYQTSDGVLHASQNKAARHADQRYGKALTAIASKLCTIDKYGPMTEFLDANLAEFQRLMELKADMIVPTEEEEET